MRSSAAPMKHAMHLCKMMEITSLSFNAMCGCQALPCFALLGFLRIFAFMRFFPDLAYDVCNDKARLASTRERA